MQFEVTRWDRINTAHLSELQAQFIKEGLFPYDWSNAPGDTYAPHVHDYDKVIIVVRGSITWVLPANEETFETHAGDRIESAARHVARGASRAARRDVPGRAHCVAANPCVRQGRLSMCGRFTLTVDPADLQMLLELGEVPADLQPRYNIAPTQPWPWSLRRRIAK